MGHGLSWRAAYCLLLGLVASPALTLLGQYPGRIEKQAKAEPVLRSVAVLEWVGSAGKPSASRLVPVTVYDGEQLNDGTIYMTRPEPLALAGDIEYELQTAGKPMGVFDLAGAGQNSGAWFGVGIWRSLSSVAAVKAKDAFNTSSLAAPIDVQEDDHPVLKRKHPKGTDTDDSSASSGGSGDAGTKTAPANSDPDRPALKRKADSGGSDSASTGSGTGGVDPDRPTLHRSRTADSDTPETSNAAPDPDRPVLRRGKPADADDKTPALVGSPPSMQQSIAVSDARTVADHPLTYSWASPDDEQKMKSALEAVARTALGLDPAAAPYPHARANAKTTPVRKHAGTSLLPAAATELPPLTDEQFRVFELTYGASATMVLTASTPKPEVPSPGALSDMSDEPPPPVIKRGKPTSQASAPAASTKNQPKAAPQKFVTLIAQPDLYGGVLVLEKSVTDAAHLDLTPRMRLVDAVDAMGDNRGELLFELRGAGQRQFALYRVLRGSSEQLFATVAIP